ncbi:MAG: hypothetical protein IJV41_07165 [Oscillospiraceae bacterium]|nr:hypothetical protein [Oscillospiraceae bacterium]
MENTHRYDDIKYLPHHQSSTRSHMSLHDRAAQFAPFAALTGYEDMLQEEARLTQREIELSEAEKQRLDRKLAMISERLSAGDRPIIRVRFFVPDERKSGGRYEEYTGAIRKLNAFQRKLVFEPVSPAESMKEIEVDRIVELHGDSVDELDTCVL